MAARASSDVPTQEFSESLSQLTASVCLLRPGVQGDGRAEGSIFQAEH